MLDSSTFDQSIWNAFSGRASPETILSLLSALKEREAQVEGLQDLYDKLDKVNDETMAAWKADLERAESAEAQVAELTKRLEWRGIDSAPKTDAIFFHPETDSGRSKLPATVRVGYRGDWPNRPPSYWYELPPHPKEPLP